MKRTAFVVLIVFVRGATALAKTKFNSVSQSPEAAATRLGLAKR